MPLCIVSCYTVMNSKTSVALSVAIAAVVLLFASGPIIGNHQALASGHDHFGHHDHHHHHHHHHEHRHHEHRHHDHRHFSR
jgi:hypothetical protein